MYLVRRVAAHLKGRLPDFIDQDDLEQMGVIGLIEAARGFDPSRGVPFEPYARTRIRGAILDALRKQSDLPRSAMQNQRTHNEAQRQLSQELGRAPTQAEIAEELGLDVDDFQKERNHAHQYHVVAMEDVTSEVELLSGDSLGDNPEQLLETTQIQEQVATEIDALPERDKLVLALYYVEELTLKEIGSIIGVSESRVSQILSSNAAVLRKKLRLG